MPESAIPGLSGFVLFFALPCMLFRFTRSERVHLKDAAFGALTAAFPNTRFNPTVLVLAAALPSASTVSLLAERYGADNGRVKRIIVASTALAFVTFTLLAWLSDAIPQSAVIP